MASLEMPARPVPGRNDALVVELIGALDPTTVIGFERNLKHHRENGIRHLLFDCRGMKYCNCTGLGSLVATAHNFEKQHRVMALFNVHPKVKVVFDMLGLTTFFVIKTSEAEALSLLSGQGSPPAPPRSEPTVLEPAAGLEIKRCSPGPVFEARMFGSIEAEDVDAFEKRLWLVCTPLSRYLLLDVSGLKSLDQKAEAWLVDWAGEMVRRGGCVALIGLNDTLRQQLKKKDRYSAFEHYNLREAARNSIQSVIDKEPAYVQEVERYFHQRTAMAVLGANLGASAEKQVGKYLDDFTDLPWLNYLVLDVSKTKTLAPEVELQVTRAASALKDRGGLLAVAGMSDGLRKALGADGGDKLYMYFASPEGARDFIEEEFLHE